MTREVRRAPEDAHVRILVVDDSAFMRKVIAQMLSADKTFTVVDTARNGQDAVEKAKLHRPDLITLDIEMPVMDGLTALMKIRTECADPRPAVLVCSTLTSAGSHEALKAMRLGAADVIAKDANLLAGKTDAMQKELIAKVRAIQESRIRAGLMKPATPDPRPRVAPPTSAGITASRRPAGIAGRKFDAVLIGSSTGGPPVLERILTRLPADLPVPVVIAQHMPRMFTKSLAERLDQMCAVSVVHGDGELALHPGTVYISEGGRHGTIARGSDRKLRFLPTDEPATALYKPSVNELFASGANTLGAHVLAIVLTGMGDDGLIGAGRVREAGGVVLAQSAETCVVYGMPRAVIEASLATSHTPDELAALVAGLATGGAATRGISGSRPSAA